MTEAEIIAGRLSLEVLSAAATQGEWKASPCRYSGVQLWAGEPGPNTANLILEDGDFVADAQFIAALVNAYRSGALVPAAVRQVLQERGE